MELLLECSELVTVSAGGCIEQLQIKHCCLALKVPAVPQVVYRKDACQPHLSRDHFSGSAPNIRVSPNKGILQVQSPVGKGSPERSGAWVDAARHRRLTRATCCHRCTFCGCSTCCELLSAALGLVGKAKPGSSTIFCVTCWCVSKVFLVQG